MRVRNTRFHRRPPHNEVRGEDLFSHFHPGQRLQVDYCEKGSQNYLMIVDYVSGYMQAYKTNRKSTEEAVKCVRSWGSKWGLPYEIKSDNGPAFSKEWENELKKTRDQGFPQFCLQ